MATTKVIPLTFNVSDITLAPGESHHYHVDPGAAGQIPNTAIVQVMVWAMPSDRDSSGAVVRAENFKTQLAHASDFGDSNSYRYHWDVVNESATSTSIRMSLLVISP